MAVYELTSGVPLVYPIFSNWLESDYHVARHLRTGKVAQGCTQKEAEDNVLILLQLIEESKRLDGMYNDEVISDEIEEV